MKRKLLLAICFGFVLSGNAQAVIYQEDFESATPAEGWDYVVANGPGISGGIITSFPAMQQMGFSGTAIGAATYTMVAEEPVHVADVDVLFLTPAIDLPEEDSYLSYKVGSLVIGEGDAHYSVYIATVEELQPLTTITQLKELIDSKSAVQSTTISGESSIKSVDLSEYSGESIVVVFRLHDTDASTLLIFDDIVIAEGTLGVQDIADAQFSVYPNPATEVINIAGSNGPAFKTMTITDINGRTVLTKQLEGVNAASIDVSGLNTGMYLMTTTSDKGTFTKKFVKQ